MNFHAHYAGAQLVSTCLVGAGDFGRSFLAQTSRMRLMASRVVVDLQAEVAAKAFHAAGADPAAVRICRTAAEARAAWDAGACIATDRLELALEVPVDVVVEATGDPEAGARHARMAIEADRHVAMVSKEADSVVGPGLAAMAQAHGRVATLVDGDQPSLLVGLVTWAETLGFEILAAGKSSEYDFVFDPKTETIDSNGRVIDARGFGAVARLRDLPVTETVAARAELARTLPQKIVPDLCEMTLVANATGLEPDRPDLHVPIARIDELPTILNLRENGGVLSASNRLEVFQCLREPDELSFAGGVFVVVRCTDPATWTLLEGKGHVVSRDRSAALIWLPRHLLGLEAATSILDASVHGLSGGAAKPRHHTDLVLAADVDFPAGAVLTMGGHHHTVEGASARMIPAAPLSPEAPAPFYLVSNRRLMRPVAKGEMVRLADVEIDASSELLKLRKWQDDRFFGRI